MQRVSTLLAGMALLASAQQVLEEPQSFSPPEAVGDDPFTECKGAAQTTWQGAVAICQCITDAGDRDICLADAQTQLYIDLNYCNYVVAPCRDAVDQKYLTDKQACLSGPDPNKCLFQVAQQYFRYRNLRIEQCTA